MNTPECLVRPSHTQKQMAAAAWRRNETVTMSTTYRTGRIRDFSSRRSIHDALRYSVQSLKHKSHIHGYTMSVGPGKIPDAFRVRWLIRPPARVRDTR
jgi:hypothetical protein